MSFQSPISFDPDAPVRSVILSVTPSLNALEDPFVIPVVAHDEQAPTARVPPLGSTVSCQATESESAPSPQPDVVGSLKSKSVPALSQTAVVAEAASDTTQPLSAASGFLI